MTTEPEVREVLEAGTEGGVHSPLYVWMLRHFDALRAEFDARGPQWDARLKAMQEAGLTNANGTPLKKRTVMQTWYRVCRVVRGKTARPMVASEVAALAALRLGLVPPEQLAANLPQFGPPVEFKPSVDPADARPAFRGFGGAKK